MAIYVSFPFSCSCGQAGVCTIGEPVPIGAMHVARDCSACGNTIIITPLRKISDAIYEYNVRICKTEREDKIQTPIK